MSNPVQNINNKITTGTCPHGLASGACPICSGMGGGSIRAGERKHKAGEMTYHECVMAGLAMKARAEILKKQNLQKLSAAERLINFENSVSNLSAKLSEFAKNISKNFAYRPAAFLISSIIVPLLNITASISRNLSDISAKLSQLKLDIQDKLNAIFGEIKNFINDKITKLLSKLQEKTGFILKIFKRNEPNDDESRVEEEKKAFRLKIIIQKLRKKKDNDTKY